MRTRRGTSFGTPEESITKEKAQRLIATAETYLDEHQASAAQWRIDFISVEIDHQGRLKPLRHIKNAVEGPSTP